MDADLSVARRAAGTIERRAVRVRGTVQGVGFRPFVHQLAVRHRLAGWVRNDGAGVMAEFEGEGAAIDALLQALRAEPPPLARVVAVEVEPRAPQGEAGFAIRASAAGAVATQVPPDTAICAACVAELLDPGDRRHRHPFINCIHCGPRFTLTRALPYDRATTSMAGFPMCPECRREYESPTTRRFHAEPNACPACGPQLAWIEPGAVAVAPADPVAAAWQRIAAGGIVALKSLGGFHLACNALDPAAVARLRARKQREDKPFALMVANAASAALWTEPHPDDLALLQSPEHPIVLVRKRPRADAAMPLVAPGIDWLGLMLPYTPLHLLLLHEAARRPAGSAWLHEPLPVALVMTSANPHGEPIVRDNDEALERLAGLADGFLVHDRPIVVRCDDSVVRSAAALAGAPGAAAAGRPAADPPAAVFVRRARGYTPRPIRLAGTGPAVLGVGGYFKNTQCVTRGDEAFVGPHLGDTDNAPTRRLLDEALAHWLRVLAVEPEAVACDLHPDYPTRVLAQRVAGERGIPLVEVQHHHAHVAAVLAEHGVDGPVLGLALDGTGHGDDGGLWGGELLRVDGAACVRLSHLATLPLPGGDAAAREPWRMGAAALHALGRGDEIARRWAERPAAKGLARMIERGLNSPRSPSMGRWFDAACGLLGVRPVASYEGQAAMQLEGLAAQVRGVDALDAPGAVERLAGRYCFDAAGRLDLLPLLAQLADERDPARGAARFHATVAVALADWVGRHARAAGLETVALGGGCFLNAVLVRLLGARLAARGLRVLGAGQVPPNDGGISLGQCWVAQRRLRDGDCALPGRAAA